jgi:hypothetical protein
MTTAAKFDLEALRRGQEEHDLGAVSSVYADDAEVRIVDSSNPPSRPRTLRGKEEVTAFWEDVLGRGMTHKVERLFATDDQGACRMACEYPDGVRVVCTSVCDLADGKIAREVIVQAWDS